MTRMSSQPAPPGAPGAPGMPGMPAMANMDTVHLVRLADCPVQAWRNGGGRTRELLRWPPQDSADANADANDWLLRVSVAEIERDGPFSAFAGVERWFAVLQGAGVQLALAQGERTLGPAGPPLHFAGEEAPGCRLRDGPTQDLNLMQRRGSGRAEMRLASAGNRIDGPARWRAVYAHAPVSIRCGGVVRSLAASTLLWSDAPDAGEWQVLDAGAAYWMILRR